VVVCLASGCSAWVILLFCSHRLTSSCTNLIQPDLFYQTIEAAAKDARRTLKQVVFQTQSPDHPIIKSLDNTNYLKFLVVQVN